MIADIKKARVEKLVTSNQLQSILEQYTKTKPISVVYQGSVDMYKKDNPFFGRVQKTKKFTGKILADLGGERVKVGNTDPIMPRVWGKRVGSTCLIKHNGATYLEFFVKSSSRPTYALDGITIKDRKIVKTIEAKIKKKAAPDVITVSFENVISVKISGVTYIQSNR